ncbi:MAG: hypothetical protein JXB20_01180 [Bacilli bacterium]|nr:hypothetical protein [Bacilli bacterium]MBN2696940.1 hypothetical protein [Bacilli bacterium]
MKDFFRRVFDTEFLPMSEVRKIKIVLVMGFLLLITALTIPFSVFFSYSTLVKVLVLVVFGLVYGLMIILIQFNRIFPAIQLSILYSIGLTLFYTQGTSGFYAYLFFYIALTIIIFYQELYSYLTYGTVVMGLGVWFIITHNSGLVMVGDAPGSLYIYIFALVLFYLVFLIQILHNEKLYTDMNYDWVRINHVIDKYHDDIYIMLDELRKKEHKPLIHEDRQFQKAVSEISVFIAEQIKDSGKDIINVFDLYLYLHEKGIDKILDNEEISVSMKKTANRLNKYLLNQRTDMFTMIVSFFSRFRKSEKYVQDRYEYSIHNLVKRSDEQIIALAMIYQYLANEATGKDQWDQVKMILSAEEIEKLFSGPDAEGILTTSQIAFFKENQQLFKKYLVDNKQSGKGR